VAVRHAEEILSRPSWRPLSLQPASRSEGVQRNGPSSGVLAEAALAELPMEGGLFPTRAFLALDTAKRSRV
jgi:hypothetical protein